MTVFCREVPHSGGAGRETGSRPHTGIAGAPDRACPHPPTALLFGSALGGDGLQQGVPGIPEQLPGDGDGDQAGVLALAGHAALSQGQPPERPVGAGDEAGRLAAALAGTRGESCAGIAAAATRTVREFEGEAGATDDVTLVVARRSAGHDSRWSSRRILNLNSLGRSRAEPTLARAAVQRTASPLDFPAAQSALSCCRMAP